MAELVQFAGVILEDEKGRIALQLRDNNPKIINPGMWSIFGGHVEEGEEPAAAAVREMQEELSISLDPQKLTLLGKFPFKDRFFHVFHYTVTHEIGSAKLREGRSWRWCSPHEIKSGSIKGQRIVEHHVAFLEQYWSGKINK